MAPSWGLNPCLRGHEFQNLGKGLHVHYDRAFFFLKYKGVRGRFYIFILFGNIGHTLGSKYLTLGYEYHTLW